MRGRKCFLLGIFLVLMLAVAGCGNDSDGDSDSSGTTGTTGGSAGFANVVGNLSLPKASIGNTYAVILDDDLDGGNGIVSGTVSFVNANPQPYSLGVIASGAYYLYALVYNSGGVSGPPKDGDFFGYYGGTLASPPSSKNAIVTPGDVTLDMTLETFNSSGLGPPGGAIVNGTLTLPTTVTSEPYWVAIDNNIGGEDGVLYSTSGTITGNSVDYQIDNVAAGTYYVYAIVYISSEGNAPPTDGDYVGIDGGDLVSGLPSSPTVTVVDPGTTTVDLDMEQCTSGACD